uniref:Histidine triad nucleotide-binding protein 1 n=1 Tax=Cacopsylla melanoneura TaxID=428564 RepID=A0A8D8Z1Z9_9HEMI
MLTLRTTNTVHSFLKITIVIHLFNFVLGGKVLNHETQKIPFKRKLSLLEKIIRKEVPCDFLYEDDQCVAFNDVKPQAPFHFLIIPKRKITSLSRAEDSDAQILGHMMLVAKKVAAQYNLEPYRVVINNGKGSVSYSNYLHLHVLGGRDLHWPPG